MKIEYFLSDKLRQNFNEWQKFNLEIRQLLTRPGIKRVLEVGGGANPLLSLDEIRRCRLEYAVLDISATELAKAPEGYTKIQADIADPTLSLGGTFDLIFSRFLAEHVPSGHDFHTNVFNLLREGGYAFHAFPTLYTTPFLINLLLPDDLTERIILMCQPWRTKVGKEGKFRVYYDWCYGPTTTNMKKLTSLGYDIEEYTGFFGHRYYSKTSILAVLNLLERLKADLLIRFPLPLLTQYAHILLRRHSLLQEQPASDAALT